VRAEATGAAATLRTPRLDLVPGTVEMLRAEMRGPRFLGRVLGVRIPQGWPPDLYDEPAIRFSLDFLERHPDQASWSFYYFVLRDSPRGVGTAIGVGGFKGTPADGTVEVGYSVMPAFRRRGFATEAVRGFLDFAFADARVRRVIAETMPDLTASIGVLDKVGMRFIGPGTEEGTIRYGIARTERIRDDG
jgi:RimJ/RimL family protein N-acetyltransferase